MEFPVVLRGDCLDLMKTLPDKSVDLFICDLPYGCLGPQKAGGGIPRDGTSGAFGGCAWDIKINLDQFWAQVERLMKDDHTPVIHFCNMRFGYELIKSKENWFRYDLVWHKTNAVGFLLANKMPLRAHENIFVFAKKGARYYRTDEPDENKKAIKKDQSKTLNMNVYGGRSINVGNSLPAGSRCSDSIVKFSNKKAKGQHPTQKPNDLYTWLIERYSKPGDTILDPTAGSFTSVFTAHALGRNAIGMEMNEEFYNKAISLRPTNSAASSSPPPSQ